MKKIAIVAHGLSNGGAEKVASIIANYLVKRNYDVLYVCAFDDSCEYYTDPKIEIRSIKITTKNKIKKFLDRNTKISFVLSKFEPDMVISFVTKEMLLSIMRGIPVIFSLRNDPARIDNDLLSSYIRNFVYKRAKKVVFQTEGARKFFCKKIQKKGVIIDNPIQTSKLPYWKPLRKTFITACRLDYQKNLPLMIEAFIAFHNTNSSYILEIYGDGPLKNELHQLIEKKHAQQYIVLKGHTTEIHKIMSEVTAFVLTSDYEGVSNSMLEALCIGLPCICTDCPPGGAKMFIKNDINGYLISLGNKKDIVNRMIDITKNIEKFKDNYDEIIELRKRLDANSVCNKWIELIEAEVY